MLGGWEAVRCSVSLRASRRKEEAEAGGAECGALPRKKKKGYPVSLEKE